MPTNNFTTGKDVQLVIQLPTGPLQLALTDFSTKPKATTIESKKKSGRKSCCAQTRPHRRAPLCIRLVQARLKSNVRLCC